MTFLIVSPLGVDHVSPAVRLPIAAHHRTRETSQFDDARAPREADQREAQRASTFRHRTSSRRLAIRQGAGGGREAEEAVSRLR